MNEISEPTAASLPAPARDVLRGLSAVPKTLPPYLFYDAAGSALYERITELPEYYLTRAERAIFEQYSDEIVGTVAQHAPGALNVIELGAGSAKKTELLLRAVLRRQAECLYVPIDVSESALRVAEANLHAALPKLHVRPLIGTHAEAFPRLHAVEAPQLVLFIGSSIGNLEDAEAAGLLQKVHSALGASVWLALGTDLRKDPKVLLATYDDAQGVTAAFNKNVLVRINRELGGHFDLTRFRHVARWNDAASRIEMHLQSVGAQRVAIDALGLELRFADGETIHTESSVKYDLPRVDRLLARAGFRRHRTFQDPDGRFALHLAAADAEAHA